MLCLVMEKTKLAFLNISYLLISFVSIPIIFSIILPFLLLRIFVSFILRLKHGSKFGGLLSGTDSVWAVEDASKAIITALVIVKSDDTPDDFYQSVKCTIYEKFFHNPLDFPKLSSTKHQSLGYYFFLKDSYTMVDCVKSVKINKIANEVTESELQEYICEQMRKSMPKNHSGLWEVLVVINTVKHGNCSAYPVLFRFHHALGDGVSFLNILTNTLADDILTDKQNWNTRNKTLNKQHSKSERIISGLMKGLTGMLSAPTLLMRDSVMGKVDNNILHGTELSGDKIVAWKIENCHHFYPMIKRIKSKMNGCRFSDILLAAVSGSLMEFFQKYSKNVPDALTIVLPVTSGIGDFRNGIERKNVNLNLKNAFKIGLMELYISKSDASNFEEGFSMIQRLREVKTQTDIMRKSSSIQIHSCIINIMSTILPVPLLSPLLKSAHSTLAVSNIPGTQRLTGFRNKTIMDIACFIPNKGSTGLSLAILTYDNRFQISLTVDKTLISEKEKAQELVDGIFKYLSILDEEVENIT